MNRGSVRPTELGGVTALDVSQLDHAIATLRELIPLAASLATGDANEAATRFHIIDRVIFDVCGWPRDNPDSATVEFRADSSDGSAGWADYRLCCAPHPALAVVEAKRVGTSFSIPHSPNAMRLRYRRFESLNGAGDVEALEQARSYAQSIGAAVIVATNGPQWLLSRTFIEGLPRSKYPIITFSSIQDMITDISLFLDILSPEAMSVSRHISTFDRALNGEVTFSNALTKRWASDRGMGENEFSPGIRFVMQELFDRIDLPGRVDMLERCYVYQQRSKTYNQRLETALKDHFPPFIRGSSVDPVDDEREDAPRFRESIVAKARSAGEVILVVGNVGVGKTTFLNRFFDIVLPGKLKNKLIVARVDFNEMVESAGLLFDASQLGEKVAQRIVEDLSQRASERGRPDIDPTATANLRGIYAQDISRRINAYEAAHGRKPSTDEGGKIMLEEIERGQADAAKTLRGFANFVKGSLGVPLCIALDNVDHTGEAHERFVYNFAVELSGVQNCVCVVAMRQDTYYRYRKSGFLSTRNDPVFLIHPPSLQQVVARRIQYGNDVLFANRERLASFTRRAAPFTPAQIVRFLEVVNEMLLDEAGEVRQLVEVLSRRSIREAFRIIGGFATSGHMDVSRLITDYNDDATRHHFRRVLRALMLENNQFYHPQRSRIPNLYASAHHLREPHFLRVRLLQRAVFARDVDRVLRFRGSWITDELMAVGYETSVVATHFAQLVTWGMFDPTLAPPAAGEAPDDEYEISALGLYFFERLACNFTYLQYISEDVVFYSKPHFDAYMSARSDQSLLGVKKAATVVKAVVDYLEWEENQDAEARPALKRTTWYTPFGVRLREVVPGELKYAARDSTR